MTPAEEAREMAGFLRSKALSRVSDWPEAAIVAADLLVRLADENERLESRAVRFCVCEWDEDGTPVGGEHSPGCDFASVRPGQED